MPISVEDLNLPLRGAPGWDVPFKAAIVELVDSVNAQEEATEAAVGVISGAVDASDATIAAAVASSATATNMAIRERFAPIDSLRRPLDIWDEFRVDGTGGFSWNASTYAGWIAGIDARLSGAGAVKSSIGTDLAGNTIWCYTFGADNAPHALLVGGTHGSESLSQHAVMRFFTEFVDSDNPVMVGMRGRMKLSFIPTLTPSSYQATVNNSNGVNVNRNFPFFWDFYVPGLPKGASALSELEAQALKNLLDTTDIACVADCHMLATSGSFLLWQGPSSWTAGNRQIGYSAAALFDTLYNSSSPVTFTEFGSAGLGDPMISNWAEHYMRNNLGRTNASSMLFEARTDILGSSSLIFSSRAGIRLYCGMIHLYLLEWLQNGQQVPVPQPRFLHAYRTNRQPTIGIASNGTLLNTTVSTPLSFEGYPGSAGSTDFRNFMDIPIPAPGEIEVFGQAYFRNPTTGTPGEQRVGLALGVAPTPIAGGSVPALGYTTMVDTIPAGVGAQITATTQARLPVTSVSGGSMVRVQLFAKMNDSAATPAEVMFAGLAIRYWPSTGAALKPTVKLAS